MKKCENCDRQIEAEYYTGQKLKNADKGYKCSRCFSHPKNALFDAFEPRKECLTCGRASFEDTAENEYLIENTCKKCQFVPREKQNDSWIPRPEEGNYEK